MDPSIGRFAFGLGILILVFSLISFPYLNPEDPEFIVNTIALVSATVLLIYVTYDVRKQVRIKREKTEEMYRFLLH